HAVHLPLGCPAPDHDVVRDLRELPHIQHQHILALVVRQQPRRLHRKPPCRRRIARGPARKLPVISPRLRRLWHISRLATYPRPCPPSSRLLSRPTTLRRMCWARPSPVASVPPTSPAR